MLICLFHTLRTFRREVSSNKMGITVGQRTLCLENIQKMDYASNPGEYNELYKSFETHVPKL